MKMSKISLDIKKSRSTDEPLSQQFLLQTGLIKRYSAGIYGKHHFLVKALHNIEKVIRQVLDNHSCIEIELPTLQPKGIWEKSGRWEVYNESGQMFSSKTKTGTFCMAPTAEEAVLEFVGDSITSYKYLPVNYYQITQKYRNEIRSRGGLLRSKEFTMMDAYSFHEDSSDLAEEYLNMKNAYIEIFKKLDLPVVPILATNGDMGGDVSEEFMVISDIGEDRILVNQDMTMGLNKEVLEMENANDYLKSEYDIDNLADFEEKSCIEVGHIFQLGTKYSENMNIYFRNRNNQLSPFVMGCYGLGVSRVLAAICEVNCDQDGLYWPLRISPYQASIIYKDNKKDEANKLYDFLRASDIEIIIDDRDGFSMGSKINDWKLLGLPYAIIIGDRNLGSDIFEIENRKSGEKLYLDKHKLKSLLTKF